MVEQAVRLLLDTHALLWWFDDDPSRPRRTVQAISDENNHVYVSAVSAYEIAYKNKRGKLPDMLWLVKGFTGYIRDEDFEPLDISMRHMLVAGVLNIEHGDPWDRILIAQAISEDLTLVSNESLFDSTGVKRLW